MDLDKLIKDSYNVAKNNGFFTCPACKGYGSQWELEGVLKNNLCSACKGSGKDETINLSSMLMGVVEELGEIRSAYRNGKKAKMDYYEKDNTKGFNAFNFECNIKDSFEDEIADAFISLGTTCGKLNAKPSSGGNIKYNGCLEGMSVSSQLFEINKNLGIITKKNIEYMSWYVFKMLEEFADLHEIDIERHIDLKMQYNKTRPYRNGKKY